jgi:hypothetical protein
MPRLYRNPNEPMHWLVWCAEFGWSRFPAKINGWNDRRPALQTERKDLRRVPLRLAFNTGLIEAFQQRRLDRAA